MRTVGVIPARYDSTRLPGKPLMDIAGKPMLRHVWELVQNASEIDESLIATDDMRIKEAAEKWGAKVAMTSASCASGTDRVAEATQGMTADVIINIQGDEPLLNPADLDALASFMKGKPEAGAATLYIPVSPQLAHDRNIVKVIFADDGRALYFSRAVIPYPGNTRDIQYYGHLGVYAYRPDLLRAFTRLPQSSLEKAEKLEQLRLLQTGNDIWLVRARTMGHGVDTPADLEYVRSILSGGGSHGKSLCDVELIITDVDGVLTDGSLYFGATGEELKCFNARDGLGFLLARKAGLTIAVASGRDSPPLQARLRELGVELVESASNDKKAACMEIMRKTGIGPVKTLFMGDDLPDLAAFDICGFRAAPADANSAVKSAADIVTAAKGGRGAFRELVDAILNEKSRRNGWCV